MAGATYADCRGGRQLRALRAVRLIVISALPNPRSALEFLPEAEYAGSIPDIYSTKPLAFASRISQGGININAVIWHTPDKRPPASART